MFRQSFRQLCSVAVRSFRRPDAVSREIGMFGMSWKSSVAVKPGILMPMLPWDSVLRAPEGAGEVKMELDSVMRKRKKKMKKHKLRKRRKREKAEKRKLSQGR
ncbi:hypothetical protein HG537_0B05165 [Torulaspora globosa]|uniref:Ribosomal protein mS38 C-terminal domain-containing protein n=1 Tax=Torulaspora globosa TaxID=48254 RepID=A0A7H9HPG2_9SACH|nr:hypothetical protein HG537_0B05165 [Torulaspora sp. CBS 2947]